MPEPTPSETPQSKKQEIISNLPKKLIEELSAHLQAAQIEEDNYRIRHKKEPKPLTEDEEKAQLAGRLFEILVEMEFSPNQTEMAKTILSLLQNPDRCKELNLPTGRNPDLTFIEIDSATGLPVVKGIGDAKLGRWDDRVREQLIYAPKTLNSVLGVIHQTEDAELEKMNLSVFAGDNKKVKAREPLEIIIFAPADVDQNKWEDNIKVNSARIKANSQKELEEEIKAEKAKLAQEMRQKGIRVVNSSFSRKEVGNLTDLFYAEILAARKKQLEYAHVSLV